ncbi:hypothetical protein L1887_53990 [Cichorium endivia]|nr:hypothetical protein L1887_53990 [Cichorium endivia]
MEPGTTSTIITTQVAGANLPRCGVALCICLVRAVGRASQFRKGSDDQGSQTIGHTTGFQPDSSVKQRPQVAECGCKARHCGLDLGVTAKSWHCDMGSQSIVHRGV